MAFSSARDGGVAQIYRMPASGAGEPVRLTDGGNYKMVQDWIHGRYIVYSELGNLRAVPSEGGTPLPVVGTPSTENDSEISPDGRWIAFVSNDSGRFEVVPSICPRRPCAARTPTGFHQRRPHR